MTYTKAFIISAVALTVAACTPKLVEPEGFVCRTLASGVDAVYEAGELTIEERNSAIERCNAEAPRF